MQAYYLRVENDLASSARNQLGVLLSNDGVVHDAGRRNLQGPDSTAVWLNLAKLVALEDAQSRHAICDPALMQLLQTWNFFRAGSDHQLAALLERDSLLLTEAFHGRGPGHAIPRFQRAGFVVETGVDDSAVVPRLMSSNVIFFIYDQKAHCREPSRSFQSRRQSNNACANYQEIRFTVGHNVLRCLIDTRLYGPLLAAAMTSITKVAAALPER